jgi:hypothetical protein
MEVERCRRETRALTPTSRSVRPSISRKGFEKRGISKDEAERRAWATVNKQEGGGKESGSGRSNSRSESAKEGWQTRRSNAGKK